MSELDVDPVEFFKGTVLEEFAEKHRDKAGAMIEELTNEPQEMEFRGFDMIFTAEDGSFEERVKIHEEGYNEEDYE